MALKQNLASSSFLHGAKFFLAFWRPIFGPVPTEVEWLDDLTDKQLQREVFLHPKISGRVQFLAWILDPTPKFLFPGIGVGMAYILYASDFLRKAPFFQKIKTAYTPLELSHLTSILSNLSQGLKPSLVSFFRAESCPILMPTPPSIMISSKIGAERATYKNSRLPLNNCQNFCVRKNWFWQQSLAASSKKKMRNVTLGWARG